MNMGTFGGPRMANWASTPTEPFTSCGNWPPRPCGSPRRKMAASGSVAASTFLNVMSTAASTDSGQFYPDNSGNGASVMIEDRNGDVWIGTPYNGLYRHSDSGFQPVETSHGGILSLIEDREGNIWAGTSGGGLNRIRPRAITIENKETGLPFSSVEIRLRGPGWNCLGRHPKRRPRPQNRRRLECHPHQQRLAGRCHLCHRGRPGPDLGRRPPAWPVLLA